VPAQRGLNAMDAVPPNDLTTLTAAQAARHIATNRLRVSDYIEALLARVAAREPEIQAWAYLDPDELRAAARQADAGPVRGPLHGVPIGIKDVIATSDQPTECNSPIYRGHRPATDAVTVARLRAAGALIMGKTMTTEFAYMRPGPTRNPHDIRRTPGGSSSGSAAAVADRMVPVALGTQTGGSTIRPAAFCGVYGYKPALGRFDAGGLKYLAPSLDTIGLMARDLDDLALVASVLANAEAPMATAREPPALVLYHPIGVAQAEASALACVDRVGERAAAQKAAVRWLAAPDWLADLDVAHRTIMSAEVARSLAKEWRDSRGDLSPELASFIEQGMKRTEDELAHAWAAVVRGRHWFASAVRPGELLLTLPAAGEAPIGLASTGNAQFNRLWTLLHMPCLTLPVGNGPNGMPLGVQVVETRGAEALLFAAARWLVEAMAA
jgi:Asp-tRNA(Asn)/Glu-tRNA(Gln) amidotransferase A subunit family amidase